jgi:hypothetical protein
LIPTFAEAVAEVGCECWNRATSASDFVEAAGQRDP